MSLLWRPETPVLFVSTRDTPLKYYAYYYEEIMKFITDQAATWGARTPKWYKYFKLEGYDTTKSLEYNENWLNVPTGAVLSQPSYYRNNPKPVESFRLEFIPLAGGKQQLVVATPGRSANPENPAANKTWLPDYTIRNYYWDIVEYLARYINTMNVSLSDKDKADNWALLERWGVKSGSLDSYRGWTHNPARSIGFPWTGWDTLFRDWHNPALGKNFQNYKDFTNEIPPYTNDGFFEKILDVHLDSVRPRWVLQAPKGIGVGAVDVLSIEYGGGFDANHIIHDGILRDQNLNSLMGIKFLFPSGFVENWLMTNVGHIRYINSRGEAQQHSGFREEIPALQIYGYAIYSSAGAATSATIAGGYLVYVKGGSLYRRKLPTPPTVLTIGPERGPIKIKIKVPRNFFYTSELLPIATDDLIISSFSFVGTNTEGGSRLIIKESGTNKFWCSEATIWDESELTEDEPNKIYINIDSAYNIDIPGELVWRPAPVFFKGQVQYAKEGISPATLFGLDIDQTHYNLVNSSATRNICAGALKHFEAKTLVKAYDDRIVGLYNDRVGIEGSGDFIDLWVLRNYGYPQPWAVRTVLAAVDATADVDDSNISHWVVGLPGYEANFYDVEYRRVYRFTFEKWWDADKLRPLNCSINLRYPHRTLTPGLGTFVQVAQWKNKVNIKAFIRNSGPISATDWALGEIAFSADLEVAGRTHKSFRWFNFDVPLTLEYGKDLIIICSMNGPSREYYNSGSGTSLMSNATSLSAILSYGGDPEAIVDAGSGYGNNDYGDDYGN